MTVSTTTDAPVDLEVDLLLLPFTEGPPDPFVDALSETLGPAVERAIRDFEAEEGSARVLYPEHTVAPRVAFVGLGAAADLDAGAFRAAGASGADVALDHEAETVACLMPVEDDPSDAQTAQGLIEGFILAAYRYRRYETADGFDGPSALLVHVGDDHDRASVRDGTDRGQHLAAGAGTARDLVNRSPDEKTARQFADAIAASGEAHGYQVDMWDEERIREEEMGGLPADALSYAADTYEPEVVVDLATLTGSCIVALGQAVAGVMMSETDDAAERLYAIQRAGSGLESASIPSRCDEYEERLESDIADLQNVGGRQAVAITAGKFPEHFVGDFPWLHLDVAGLAFRKTAKAYRPKGGTGFGVRLRTEYLSNYVGARDRS